MPQVPNTRPPLTLLTLGVFEFEGVDARAAGELLRQPKRAAVLLFMLLNRRGGFTTREELMGMFWTEADNARARNSLRQTLSFLRDALGEDVILNHGTSSVGVAPGNMGCDAASFEDLLDREGGRRLSACTEASS